jgi:alanine racemase
MFTKTVFFGIMYLRRILGDECMELSNTWVNIDLDAITANYLAVQEKAEGAQVCAVVKADAYGHGAVAVAKHLQTVGADFFAVSSVAEAVQLRNAGIDDPILLLGHTSSALYREVVEYGLRPAIFDENEAKALSEMTAQVGRSARIHLVVDTGMGRIGFQVTPEAADACARIAKLPGIMVEGLFTHYARADEADPTDALRQATLFHEFKKLLRERGVRIPLCHADNSAGVMHFGCGFDMVRAGIALYGVYPSDEMDKSELPLKPAMTWETAVSFVKTLPAGRPISYGGTYVTDKQTVVATIPVGYADGYRRKLSGNFYVLIHGKKAPVVGRVCMDQTMVDVTDIPGVKTGDRVVLMGTDGNEAISIETLSAAADSFAYEQMCDIGYRVARVYYKNGEKQESVNYLINE